MVVDYSINVNDNSSLVSSYQREKNHVQFNLTEPLRPFSRVRGILKHPNLQGQSNFAYNNKSDTVQLNLTEHQNHNGHHRIGSTVSGTSKIGSKQDDTNTLAQLLPKTRMKTAALNKRNLSKVAYIYQPKLRPSSPSYMSSTSASRNRTSKVSSITNSPASSTIGTSSFKGPARPTSNQTAQQKQRQRRFLLLAQSNDSGGSNLNLVTSQNTKVIGIKSRNSRRKRARFRLSISHHEMINHSTASVVMKEKFLMKIFNNLSWNELVAIRGTCKKWCENLYCIHATGTIQHLYMEQLINSQTAVNLIRYEIIQTPLKKEGVIMLRWNLEGMSIFNNSMYVWTQFRIFVSVVFDFTDPMQQEFWTKHGKTMTFLEIRNSSMTLSALVQILSRCPNLEKFSVTWTAEMFGPMLNSEMIKKYYGIHFRNGTFAKLHELTIDKSYFLTDNALWSLLKWCGGSIRKLALTCDKSEEDFLGRLKPRWSIEPIENYCSRFAYSGNFKFLDFSGSNLTSEDLKTLARTEKLNSLIGIRLSKCNINDDAIILFVAEKGANLEELHVENNQISEKAFEGSTKLQKLKSLNISGKKGNFRSLDFLKNMRTLKEFFCYDTTWLTYSTIARADALGSKNSLKILDISSSNNIISRVDQRMNKIWFNNLTNMVPRLTELNLNYCGTFGNDDNFKAICTNILTLEKLCVRDWTALTDEGLVGMSFDDIIKQYDDVKGFWKNTDTQLVIPPVLCNLKYLRFLDLAGCKKLTDICVQFAIIHLPRLSKLGLDKTQITDASYNILISKSTIEKLCLAGCEHVSPKGSFTRTNGRLIFNGKLSN